MVWIQISTLIQEVISGDVLCSLVTADGPYLHLLVTI